MAPTTVFKVTKIKKMTTLLDIGAEGDVMLMYGFK